MTADLEWLLQVGNFDARGVRTAVALGQWLQEQDIAVDDEGKQVVPASRPKVAIATSGRASSMPVKRRGMVTKVDPLHDPFAGMASGGELKSLCGTPQNPVLLALLSRKACCRGSPHHPFAGMASWGW